jgi:hypothetical protein
MERADLSPGYAVPANIRSSRLDAGVKAIRRSSADRGSLEGVADLEERVRQAPLFEHPHRRCLLARTPYSAVGELSRLSITPSLGWPDDHAWCVATEIDFDSTLVGCSKECASALLTDDRLKLWRYNLKIDSTSMEIFSTCSRDVDL